MMPWPWRNLIISIALLITELIADENCCGETETSEEDKDFFIDTPTCKMPYVAPFTPDVLDIWKEYAYENCSAEKDAITVVFDKKRKLHKLQINENSSVFLNQHPDCSYTETVRVGPSTNADNEHWLGKAIKFKDGHFVPRDVDGILIKCTDQRQKELYADAFSFIQHTYSETGTRAATPGKIQIEKNKITHKNGLNGKPNVIILGVDTLSRMNFRRNFPKLFSYFNKEGWYEMEGYNKVAENTYPNVMSFLSGYNPMNADKLLCNTSTAGCIDTLPLVWKEYKNAGYLTSYAEDLTYMNVFTYKKPGFIKKPVDYYLRPFLMAIEKNMVLRKRFRLEYCIGRRVTMSYIYDYCQQLIDRYLRTSQRVFGLFWTCHFTHEEFSSGSSMDQKMLDYVIDYGKAGLYNNSIVFFISDHGIRKGPLIKLPQGYLEERIPILFIWLPKWIREKYPDIEQALIVNKNRLTSPYDVHLTLQHILQLDLPYPVFTPRDCPTCQSLFYPVPKNRTCHDAGIVESYCTCENFETVDYDLDAYKPLPNLVVQSINDYIHEHMYNELCTNLTLSSVRQVAMKNDKVKPPKDPNVGIFRVHVNVKGGKEFCGTVRYNTQLRRLVDAPVETYDAMNGHYSGDGHCVSNKIIKKFCICKDNTELKEKNRQISKLLPDCIFGEPCD